MSKEYFDYFPTTTYKGFTVRDIMRRTKIVESWESNPYLFLPYTVEGDDSAEDVAFYYYGDPHYVWLVYLANNIINPYEDWVMGSRYFQKYLAMKYREISGGLEDHEVIAWTHTNREFYVDADETRITPFTYDCLSDDIKPNWNLVTTYDFEEWKNESKRNIRLVNKAVAKQAIAELREALNE